MMAGNKNRVSDYEYQQATCAFRIIKALNEGSRKELWRMLRDFNICLECGHERTHWGCSDDCGTPEMHFGASNKDTVPIRIGIEPVLPMAKVVAK